MQDVIQPIAFSDEVDLNRLSDYVQVNRQMVRHTVIGRAYDGWTTLCKEWTGPIHARTAHDGLLGKRLEDTP